VLLGPAWAEVVLPFRLFTISLLFRMSSKISDACTKAAGEVYCQALLQGTFGAMEVLGSLVGRHWGAGGVAVSIAGEGRLPHFFWRASSSSLRRSASGGSGGTGVRR
jgi:hypothetical protein